MIFDVAERVGLWGGEEDLVVAAVVRDKPTPASGRVTRASFDSDSGPETQNLVEFNFTVKQ